MKNEFPNPDELAKLIDEQEPKKTDWRIAQDEFRKRVALVQLEQAVEILKRVGFEEIQIKNFVNDYFNIEEWKAHWKEIENEEK